MKDLDLSMMDSEMTTSPTTTPLEPSSTLEAMLRQEEAYVSSDYLYQHQDATPATSNDNGPLHLKDPSSIEQDRTKMVAWKYQVADFCHFDRETVAIATGYFDRFLSTQDSASAEALTNTDLFQLAAMTCFYTAAKIHEPESFEPWMLSKMSRGLYTPEQVEKMEMVILQAIQWRVNPPTALAFVREFLSLLPESYLGEAAQTAVYDLCKFQTELCVRIYEFVPVKASVIAMAALLNALESIGMDYATLGMVERFLSDCVKVAPSTSNISTTGSLHSLQQVQERLYQAVTEFSGTHTEVSKTTMYPAKQTLCGGKRSLHYHTSPCAVQIYTTAA